MDWNWSLTGGDCPHFASDSQAALVSCVNVAVVVGGGLQVPHDSGEIGAGVGGVQRLSGGLRSH